MAAPPFRSFQERGTSLYKPSKLSYVLRMTGEHAAHFTSPTLPVAAHRFCSRLGGVSQGLFSSLNCSLRAPQPGRPTDSPENVSENKRLALEGLLGRPVKNADALVTLKQVHSSVVHVVEEKPTVQLEGDALVTTNPDLVLGIQTADCVPLLIFHPSAVAAVHVGWRGAYGGIVKNVLSVLEGMGVPTQDIRAAIGPCIHQSSYEVSPELQKEFCSLSSAYKRFFEDQPNSDKAFFDLPGLASFQLEALGVNQTQILPYDTYAEERLFFSCRRAAHRGEAAFGGQISLIRRVLPL